MNLYHPFRPAAALSFAILAVVLTVTLAAPADILYIGQGYAPPNNIWRYDTDAPNPSLETLSSVEPGGMMDIHLDAPSNRMYWTVSGTSDSAPGWIRSADLDGANPVTISSAPETGYPRGIAVDPAAGYIYYGSYPGQISTAFWGVVRMNLDGSNRQLLIPTSKSIYSIELDLANDKMYWIEYGNAIRRSNLDGTGIEDVIPVATAADMELDLARGLAYWIGDQEILCAPLDGSQPPQQIISSVRAYSLALSPDGNRIYYGDAYNERVYQLNPDGTGHQLTTYANNPFALEVMVPEPASLALLALGMVILWRPRKTPQLSS